MELTRAEEKLMNILWDIQQGLIRDIVEKYDDPKPAYTTVATIVNILEKKGIVERKPVANSHIYFPVVKREQYTRFVMKNFVGNYFSNSFKRLVSEFSHQGNLTTDEMEELIEELQKEVNRKTSG